MSKYLDRPCRSLAEVLREREERTMLPMPERSPEELNEALKNRMELLADCIVVIDGMTKRGAVLPEKYREETLSAIRRYAERVFTALDKGAPANQPWDKERAA